MWRPMDLPSGPVLASDSDVSIDCPDCGASAGDPCETSACGTFDIDDR
jgi:hypothetical protein